jgi:hypothetical protein
VLASEDIDRQLDQFVSKASESAVKIDLMREVGYTVDQRLAYLRSDKDYVAASMNQDAHLWLRPVFIHGLRKPTDDYAGFKVSTYGFAVGVDAQLYPGQNFGLAFAYFGSESKERLNDSSLTRAHSYHFMPYGTYDLLFWGQKYGEIDWLLSYTRHNTDSIRNISIPGFNDVAVAVIESNQYTIRFGYTNMFKLNEEFSKFGEVVFARVVLGPDRRSKGFGFVEFANEEDAAKAQESMDETEYEGRTIKVDFAKENPEKMIAREETV